MPSYPPGVHTVGAGQWPYDDGTLIPFGPDAQQRLATRIDLLAGSGIGLVPNETALQTLITNGDAFAGLIVHAADTDVLWKYDGSKWVPVAAGYFGIHSGSGQWPSAASSSMSATAYNAAHGGIVAASADAVTAKVDGWFRITGNVGWQTNTNGMRSLRIFKNGADLPIPLASIVPVPSGGLAPQSATGLVQASANDYFNLVLSQNSGATLNYSAQLTVEFVAPA